MYELPYPWGITKTSDDVPLKVELLPKGLLKKNSEWSYLDDGSDQGTAWREREFNDNSWATGKAPWGIQLLLTIQISGLYQR